MTEFSRAVSILTEDYAREHITAEELLRSVLALDEAYFTLHGHEFKHKLSRALLTRSHKSPRERVEAMQSFYEHFFDYACGLKPEDDA